MDRTTWLARVRHDLVKRLLWPARDRRDLGGAVVPGELAVQLVDEEGQPISAEDLWTRLLEDAPESLLQPANRDFRIALQAALIGARNDQLEPVLALEAAFERLARAVKEG